MNYVWIVEMLNPITIKWEPTTGASLDRAHGRTEVKRWERNNPCDQFRLRRYDAAGHEHKEGK